MKERTKLLTYSALMCTLIIVSTLWLKFAIPGTDMLVTTQVFFVLLCGQLLPTRYCIYTLGAYILLGLIGFPVFSSVAGLMVVVTPSFGYLLGFIAASACVARIRGRSPKLKTRMLASLAGVAVMYAVALPYIALIKNVYMKTPIGVGTLMGAYCIAFLPLDIVKAALAALLGGRLQKPLGLSGEASARYRGGQG